MSKEFLIVLFKNKKKKKIIKRYDSQILAENYFKKLISENVNIIFEKKIENATPVSYQLSILSKKNKNEKVFFVDEYGRNINAELENSDYSFFKIVPYKLEETIFDWQLQKKISIDFFIKNYCKTKEIKSIYTLNNKICVQRDMNVDIFSLKDIDESYRFLELLQNKFYSDGRSDAIFTKDVSNAQRKWLYDILEKKGFDKKRLYRLKTTFSKR